MWEQKNIELFTEVNWTRIVNIYPGRTGQYDQILWDPLYLVICHQNKHINTIILLSVYVGVEHPTPPPG